MRHIEDIVDFNKYYKIIRSRAGAFAANQLYNARTIDEEDLIQEGHLLFIDCLQGFDPSRHDPDNLAEAFHWYFVRALKNQYMTINMRIKKTHLPVLLEYDKKAAENHPEHSIDFIERAKTTLDDTGMEYLSMCLAPPRFIHKAAKRGITFRRAAEVSLKITGRQRAKLNNQIKDCISQ